MYPIKQKLLGHLLLSENFTAFEALTSLQFPPCLQSFAELGHCSECPKWQSAAPQSQTSLRPATGQRKPPSRCRTRESHWTLKHSIWCILNRLYGDIGRCSAKQCAAPRKSTLNHLMLAWSAIHNLWLHFVLYWLLDHTPCATNHIQHSAPTLSITYCNSSLVSWSTVFTGIHKMPCWTFNLSKQLL